MKNNMNITLLLIMSFLNQSCSSRIFLPEPKPFPDVISIRTTAYCSNESDHLKYGAKTALGTQLKPGTIAADLSILPLGTVLKINNKRYEVADYGRALISANLKPVPTVDVYQTSRQQMNAWGVRNFENVEVLHWGSFQESANLLKDRLQYTHCRIMFNRIQTKL